MPARSVHDFENIIARLRTISTYVDQNLDLLDEAIAAGMMQPRVVADLVIRQIDAQLAQDADHTELLKAFRAFPSNMPRADQERLRRESLAAFEQQFLPSWRKLRAYMAETLSATRAACRQHPVDEGRTRGIRHPDSPAHDDNIVRGRDSPTGERGSRPHRGGDAGDRRRRRVHRFGRRLSRPSSRPTPPSISNPKRKCSPTRATSR